MKRLALLFLTLAFAARAEAYCPSYTASSPNNSHNCAIDAKTGTNPTVAEWNQLYARIAGGPGSWGDGLPSITPFKQGCEPSTTVDAVFPCELLKAIGMAESGWQQFCVPDSPADQVGGASRTLISFDCGYGAAQVTSGMHVGESPGFDRDMVAGDAVYNLAVGAKILADKWRAVKCVGDRQPKVIEDWYTAVWAYNGLSYTNNPNNPNFSSSRGVWNPSVGGAAPYQEKVFGWMEHNSRWPVTALAYPNPGDVGGGSGPNVLPEPDCAGPTDCAHKRSTHLSSCFAGPPPPDAGVGPAIDAGLIINLPPDAPAGGAGIIGGTDVRGGCAVGGSGDASGLALVAIFLLARRRRDGSPSKHAAG